MDYLNWLLLVTLSEALKYARRHKKVGDHYIGALKMKNSIVNHAGKQTEKILCPFSETLWALWPIVCLDLEGK